MKNICKNCKKETKNPKFCSSSCSAKYNNKARNRIRKSDILKLCLFCGKEYSCRHHRTQKYCSRVCYNKASIKIKPEKKTKKFVSENRRKAWEQIENGTWSGKSHGTLRNYLIIHRGYICEKCGLSDWMNNPIPLETHHKDGNWQNNKLDNVILICLNCHGQTNTYRSKNNGKGRRFRYGYKDG
jgi:hypothetical protein